MGNVFSHGEVRTKVVIQLTDEIDDISALDIQTVLHNAGYHVRQVHAERVYKEVKKSLARK
jgi:phosphoribosylformylglycinamidine (FGAM) synthase PurS component